MRMRKFSSLFVTLIIIMALVVAGCSKNTNNPDPAPATGQNNSDPIQTETATEQPKEPVTLKYVTYFVGQYQEEFDLFNKKYPWITIEPVVTDDVLGTVVSMVAGGDAPDLAIVDNMTTFMKQDLLEELTPYIEGNEVVKNAKIRNEFTDIYKIDGKTYAMPISDVPYWIAVNKDLLEKNGLEMPSLDWTYDDFLELAKAATDPVAGEYGLSYDSSFATELAEIVAVANGSAANFRFMNEDLTASVLNTPEVAADLQWVQDLVHKWHVRPTPEEAAQYGWDASNNFLTGKVLFGMGADWFVAGYNENASFEWDILPMPVGKKMQATMHLNGPFGIIKSSKHKEEAFLWLAFQYELEAQKWMIDNASIAFLDDPELAAYYEEVDVWKDKNVEAVKRVGETCCYTKDPAILDFDWYMGNARGPLINYFNARHELTEINAAVEQYNTQVVVEARKALGLE